MLIRGGYGLDAYGRHQYGNRSSDVEPRFELSVPLDGQHNVPVTQALKFATYYFSSFSDTSNILVYISENAGSTFVLAFDGTTFQAPYAGRIRRVTGQRLTCYITKTTNWTVNQKIVVRFVGADDFGNEATKIAPKKWTT
jgi:hypothetical protein